MGVKIIMLFETKEMIAKEWDERNAREVKRQSVRDINDTLNYIIGCLNDNTGERDGSCTLNNEQREGIIEDLQYIREMIDTL